MRSAALNPFVYSRPLGPDEAIPRPHDVAHLIALAEGGHNSTLVAPRRFGKTSLLKQVQRRAEDLDMVAVLVDLSDVLSVADVAARVDLAFRTLRGPLGTFVAEHLATVGLTLPFQLGGMTIGRPDQPPDPIAALHALLEMPVRLHERTGRRVLVAFDEFQALVALKGLDGAFRSHLQHHGEAASYLFAGSEPSMLRAMFADRSRPLYGQAELVELGRIDPAGARDFVDSRFRAAGHDAGAVLIPLVHLSEGHPQRLMLLAHQLWSVLEPGAPADLRAFRQAFEATMRRVDPELRTLWDRLPANERRVLLAVASGLSPMSGAGMTLTGLASRSSAQHALRSLRDAGLVEADDGDRPPAIIDPLLGHWARRHAGARPTAFVLPDAERPGGFVVADGPSLAFVQQRADTIDEAQAAAERLLAGRNGNIVVYDTDDPNALPVWAVGGGA